MSSKSMGQQRSSLAATAIHMRWNRGVRLKLEISGVRERKLLIFPDSNTTQQQTINVYMFLLSEIGPVHCVLKPSHELYCPGKQMEGTEHS